MIKVIYNKVCGRCVQSEPLTSGMVGQLIEFEYSSDFDGLTLTAVFTNGKTTVDVLNPGNQCIIPHEVLSTPNATVSVGIYATKGNELVIPTVYTNIGVVQKGADPSGDVSADPTLPVWAQVQETIGNLNDLTTEAKNNLVAAINEAAQTGGGGSAVELDTTLTQSGKAADAKAVGDALAGKQDKLIAGENITISADGKTISATGGGLTTAQVNALDGMFKVCAFIKDDVSAEYTAFKTAFGISEVVTLSSISVTYDGGNVAVGTAVTDLTGIVVTAHYSDGSNATVTDYTLNGTIAEGENTITVTYQGKTATFAVTGIAESSGENNGWVDGKAYAIEWTDGYAIDHSGTQGGEAIGAVFEKSGRSVSDYLPCRGVGMVELSGVYTNYGIFFYDENYAYIGKSETNYVVDVNRVSVLRNAYYIRVQKSTTSNASVVPHDLTILNAETVWESGKYYVLNWIDNKQVNPDTGAVIDKTNGTCSDFALCYGATSIQFSSGSKNIVVWYDGEMHFVGNNTRQNNTSALSVPDGAVYFRFAFGVAGKTNHWVQLS